MTRNTFQAGDAVGPAKANPQLHSETSESIPTYTEATSAYPPPAPLPPPPATALQPDLPADAPPAYTPLDTTQTSFTIYNTFIHTPVGPCYQLSSPLDQRIAFFRIRRLRPKEVQQVDVVPVKFDREYTLYEAVDLPLVDNEYHVIGKRRGCLPGVLELKYRLGKWRVLHVVRPGAKGVEILTCKKGRGTGRAEVMEWRDGRGDVLAREEIKVGGDGGIMPTMELGVGLEEKWREVLVSLWATRLWAVFGGEKTFRERWI